MTIKELKQLLNSYPEDKEVRVAFEGDEFNILSDNDVEGMGSWYSDINDRLYLEVERAKLFGL